jgi:hypothetical protein
LNIFLETYFSPHHSLEYMTLQNFMLIAQISTALSGLIVILSFLFFKKRALQIKLLGLNFLYSVLMYYSLGAFDLRGMQVNIPSNIQMLATFFTITGVYYLEFKKRYARFFVTLCISFTIFWGINIFVIQKTHFNSYTAAISNFIVMAYCIAYFYRLMIDLPARHLRQLPLFWISVGLLMQGAAATFLYIFTDYLTRFFVNDVLFYWTIHNSIVIVELLIITVGISVGLWNTLAPRKDLANVAARGMLPH